MLTDAAIRALAEEIVEPRYGTAWGGVCYSSSTVADAARNREVARVESIIRHLMSQNEPNRNTSPQHVTGGDMTFADFSRTNRERAVAWNGADPPPVEFAAMELAGEVGELCNAIKKSVRLKHGMPGGSIDIDNIRDELGDVVICADLIASRFGVDLGEAVARKFDKTSEKHGFPHRLASIGGKA